MNSAWDELTPEDFACAPVCGREQELSVLADAHDRVVSRCRSSGAPRGGDGDDDGEDDDERIAGGGGGASGGGGGGRRTSEIVVVTGPAGVGKSTLVREFASSSARRRRCRRPRRPGDDDEPERGTEERGATPPPSRYACGKFDQLGASSREPHAAIVDVVARSVRSGSVSSDELAKGMDSDCREFLGRIVPCDVRGAFETTAAGGKGGDGGGGGGASTSSLGGGGDHEVVGGGGGGGGGAAAADSSALNLNRLKYSLRQFFRTAGSSSSSASSSCSSPPSSPSSSTSSSSMPLVVFLDDLQWADESSIDVVRSVVSDPESKNVLFVLALRSDEDLAKPLEDWMDDLEDPDVATKINVGALSVDQANLLLSRVLNLSPPRVLPLSRVVHAKTSGNVLFLIQFVLHLQSIGLLRFSYEGCRWDWSDVDEIRGKTDVTGNVVELVKGRIGRLPEGERRELMVASCLGNAFRRRVLIAATRGAWEDDDDCRDDGADDENCDEDDDDDDNGNNDDHDDNDNDDDAVVADPQEDGRGAAPKHDKSTESDAVPPKKDPSSASPPPPAPRPVLETALKEGLLEVVSSTQLKFAHDKIQQAAYSLVPEDKREELHYRIGRTLWKLSENANEDDDVDEDRATTEGVGSPSPTDDDDDEEGREFLPFLAADQLNRGRSCASSSSEKIAIAELNLLVAEDAISAGAFILAADYLDHALSLLDETGDGRKRGRTWTENYDLALRLCASSAEAEHCRGDFDRSARMCREVLSNARTLEDAIPAYFVLVDSHNSAGRYGEALDVGIEVLGKLGEKCPRKPSLPSLARQFYRTHKLLKDRSNESLLDLPRMTNERKIAAMKFLSSLWLACVVSQSRTHLLLFTLRMVRLTLRWGLSELSPVGFAVYGMILCGSFPGSLDMGFRFGPLALDLQEALLSSSSSNTAMSSRGIGGGGGGGRGASRGAKEWSPRVNLFAYCGVKHFRTPLHDCPAPFVAAYNVAMSAGDIEFGLLSALHYCMFYYFSGMALDPIEKDMRAYRDQMREYKTETSLLAQVAYHQCVLNLMGKSENPVFLTGESMDEDDVRRRASESKHVQALTVVALLKMQLAYYFGASDLYGETLKESLRLSDAFKGTHWGVSQTYFEGLVSYATARETKNGLTRRASLRTARRSTKKLRALVKCSACNCLHMYLLLKAERLSLKLTGATTMLSKKRKVDVGTVQKAYDAAIVAAGKVGFLQDKALSNELAGKALLAAGDNSWASHYLSRATESYFEWGASAKAERLRVDHGHLLRSKRERRWGGGWGGGGEGGGGGRKIVGMKSRRRFSSEAADRHRRMSDASEGTQASPSLRRGSSAGRILHACESGSAPRDRRSSSASTLSDVSVKPVGGV